MTLWIENPFQGFEVGWTWAEHVKAGYQGGTDYIFYPSDGDIVAAADGRVTLVAGTNGFTPGPAILLALSDGRAINYREVARPLVKSGQMVVQGQAIGVPNKASRWPHIDATVGGKRVPFEPLVNVGTNTAGGGGTPVTPPRGNSMTSLYYDNSTTPFLFALAGDSPGTPANWLETTDTGLATTWSAQIGGPSAALNHASFVAFKAAYQAPLATTGGSGGSSSSAPTVAQIVAGVTPAVQTISDASDVKVEAAIKAIPPAPTTFKASA